MLSLSLLLASATAMLLARQMKIKLESITFDIEGDYGTCVHCSGS
jgi:hypothetical protein